MQKKTPKEKRAQEILNGFISSIQKLKIDNNIFVAIQKIRKCKGKVVTSGIGKAGIAMKKFTATLCSLGIQSCFIHPGEAAHGDLGLIGKNDILFACSNSGKTREVLELISFSKRLNVSFVIGLTSNPDSELGCNSDCLIDTGPIKEEGHLGLAPTTSVLAFQIITDIIAIIVAEENKLTKEQFSVYHHGGYLGVVARNN